MKLDEMDRSALLEEIGRMQRRIEGLKEASGQLEHQLRNRDIEIIRIKRELQDRIAESICRENEWQRDHDRFSTLVRNIPGAVYRCANDAFWTMEFMSDQIEELSGYPAADFINNSVRSFKSIVHPEDVIKVVNAVNNSINDRRPYTIEYRIRHRDGHVRRVYERGMGIRAEDDTLLWLDGVIFDQSRVNHHEMTLPEW